MSTKGDTLPYADELTDDEPILTVQYSQLWVDFLLAAVNVLSDVTMWAYEDDRELALGQVDDLVVRLMGGQVLNPPDTYMPMVYHPIQLNNSTATATAISFAANSWMHHVVYNTAPVSGQVVWAFDTYLNVGVYDFKHFGIGAVNQGIWQIQLSGADIMSGFSHDNYVTPQNNNLLTTDALTITIPGVYHCQLRVIAKNPSATNFYNNCQLYWVQKTG